MNPCNEWHQVFYMWQCSSLGRKPTKTIAIENITRRETAKVNPADVWDEMSQVTILLNNLQVYICPGHLKICFFGNYPSFSLTAKHVEYRIMFVCDGPGSDLNFAEYVLTES